MTGGGSEGEVQGLQRPRGRIARDGDRQARGGLRGDAGVEQHPRELGDIHARGRRVGRRQVDAAAQRLKRGRDYALRLRRLMARHSPDNPKANTP